MEINSIEPFLQYLTRTRLITEAVIAAIPHDKLDWTYAPGKFTMADLIRHIAGIERYVFAEIALGKKPAYKGCGKEIADGYGAVMEYFTTRHNESVEIFKTLSDEALQRKVTSVNGKEVELGKFLRALIIHEVHHRAALCIYLNLLGISSPPVLGLKEEQVIQISREIL
ncbi:MAG TPA: DinB family protein [Patescibacteria group bacterium]|nr:DinB family protein [Patescibacteria group bacterium]